MEVDILSDKIKQQLSSWFHRRDRSLYLPPSAFYYLNNGTYLSNAFISETVLSASAANVTFNNIPQGFRHLVVMSSARTDRAAENDTISIRANGDSGSNYDFQQVVGSSATASASTIRGTTGFLAGNTEAANSRANTFAPMIAWIFDYTINTQDKYCIGLSGPIGNLSADADLSIHLVLGHWRNLNVITSLVLVPLTGPNFVSGSRFQLYGIL
jgi:hypothetical protein